MWEMVENNANVPTDEELVALARAGDSDVSGQLVARHYDSCLKRALLIMQNRGDAEDEVQNACWKALQCLDQYRGEGTFAAWLGRIVENQCLMRIRQERSAYFVHLDELNRENLKVELVGQTEGPEDQLGLGRGGHAFAERGVPDAAHLADRHAASRSRADVDARRCRPVGSVGSGCEVQVDARQG